MPDFQLVVPTLRIFDPVRARNFYLEFLGFQLDFEHRFAPDLPLYMQVSIGKVVLALSEHHGDASPGARINVRMSGLSDYHNTLLLKQYRYARPGIVEEPWGDKTMTIADPFYNHVVFRERSGL